MDTVGDYRYVEHEIMNTVGDYRNVEHEIMDTVGDYRYYSVQYFMFNIR
jgi:hypothetical protein